MTDKTDIAALRPSERAKLGFVTDDNTGGYYVAECEECGKIFPSQNCDGGGQIADTGDYGDCYCPHCGHVDPEVCENANLVWNVQQLKIISLTSQLEAERQRADNANDGWGNVIAERDAAEQKSRNYEQVAHGLAAELAALKGGQMPVPPTVSFFRDGIVAAANWVDQSREAFERESGQIDPDTGTFEFSNNAGVEYSSVLFDVAEGIRQLHPNAEPATTQKPFKDIAPNDVVPVGQDWFRVRYITRHGDSTSVHLQREVEKLHPLKQNDVIHLSVENAVPLFIAVKGE